MTSGREMKRAYSYSAGRNRITHGSKTKKEQTQKSCYSYDKHIGPTLWNSLPEKLRQPDITFGQFTRSLKTFMFGQLGHGDLCLNFQDTD